MLTLMLLAGGHFVADFALQPEVMARGKNRYLATTNGRDDVAPWPWWLAAHAMTHATLVGLITQSVLLACIEAVAHALIDYLKCEDRIGLKTDQALHLACKVGYTAWLVL